MLRRCLGFFRLSEPLPCSRLEFAERRGERFNATQCSLERCALFGSEGLFGSARCRDLRWWSSSRATLAGHGHRDIGQRGREPPAQAVD